MEILVATDGSRGANAAVDHALSLAGELGAEVTFISVFRPPFPLLGDPYYQRSLEHSLEMARAAVETAVLRAEIAHVAAEGEVIEGDPATEIVKLAESRDVDLIVVGSRGHGPLASTIVGSVSTAVIKKAGCPVIVVNEELARRPQAA